MLKGFIQQSALVGKIRTSALVGTVPKSPAPVSDSDHQIITVDLYRPDTHVIAPTASNANLTTSANSVQVISTTANAVPSVTNTQVIATSWQALDGNYNFEEDISL